MELSGYPYKTRVRVRVTVRVSPMSDALLSVTAQAGFQVGREILISWVIEQRIQCAITKITNSRSGTTRSSSSRGPDSVSTSTQ